MFKEKIRDCMKMFQPEMYLELKRSGKLKEKISQINKMANEDWRINRDAMQEAWKQTDEYRQVSQNPLELDGNLRMTEYQAEEIVREEIAQMFKKDSKYLEDDYDYGDEDDDDDDFDDDDDDEDYDNDKDEDDNDDDD